MGMKWNLWDVNTLVCAKVFTLYVHASVVFFGGGGHLGI